MYHSIPVHKVIMYSCQDTPAFYCDELTMTHKSENSWSYDQNLSPASNQMLLDVKTDNNCYSQFSNTVCASDHTYALDIASIQKCVPFETNHFTDGSISYYNPVQYIPLTPDPVPSPVFYLPSQKLHCNFMAKRHCAQISFAPTRNGNFKAIVKRKRKRTVFTTEQLQSLEDIFKTKQYITREERQVIVSRLQLNDKAVKIWFQNRRLKDKKEQETEEENGNEAFSEGSCGRDITRLEYVESLIKNNTDEFGYVTLDDTVMKTLYGVVNDFLANDRASDGEDSMESGSSPIYEPISPASVSDSTDEENNSMWKPSAPNESLQRLFDLQSMLSL